MGRATLTFCVKQERPVFERSPASLRWTPVRTIIHRIGELSERARARRREGVFLCAGEGGQNPPFPAHPASPNSAFAAFSWTTPCRGEKYPRHLLTDFRSLKPATLRRYAEHHELPLRPDIGPNELAIAVASHFERFLEVDEDETLSRFLNAVRWLAVRCFAREMRRRVRPRSGALAGARVCAARVSLRAARITL